MPLFAPTELKLVSAQASPAEAVLQAFGVAGATGYDVYRSENGPENIGIKVNLALISQPGSAPFALSYTDNSTNSSPAPMGGRTYSYRMIAVDGGGNISLPSNADSATLASQKYAVSELRQNVIAYLQADAVLAQLLNNDTADRIRTQRQYREAKNDIPFLVVLDGKFRENYKRVEPGKRHGIQPMAFEAYDVEGDSQTTENILNRVAALLRDNTRGGGGRRAVSSTGSSVVFANPIDGYEEFYDDGVTLFGKRLVVEFTVVLKET